MKSFNYVITDEIGIHARPAGLLAKEAAKYTSVITLQKGDKSAEAKRLMAIMAMGVKCGEEITVTVEGDDEEAAVEGIKEFFSANL